MAQFIECEGGAVNLDHVARIEVKHFNETDKITTLLYSADDRLLGKVISWKNAPDLVELTAPVVAAPAGMVAYLFGNMADGAEPEIQDIYIEEVPIVGWRVMAGCARPVLINEPEFSETIMFSLGGKKVFSLYRDTYECLDDAKAAFLDINHRMWRSTKKADAARVTAPEVIETRD